MPAAIAYVEGMQQAVSTTSTPARPLSTMADWVTASAELPGFLFALGAEGISVAQAGPGEMAVLLEEIGQVARDMDARTRAAYLVGYVSWAVGRALAACELRLGGLPDVPAGTFGLAPTWQDWEAEGESGRSLDFVVTVAAEPDAPLLLCDAEAARTLMEDINAPLVEQLVSATGLSRGALWRLVADGYAAAWLTVGKALGREADAMRAAAVLLKGEGSPLNNSKTGFVEICVTDPSDPARQASDWFRARGGCCRYYTTPDSKGQYCSTCVLRSPQSRDQLLADYLRRVNFS